MQTTSGTVALHPSRQRVRWHIFQVVLVLTYVGVILDVITTRMAFKATGASYEQNPLGGYLIQHLDWLGLAGVLTILTLVCYYSSRIIWFRMSTRITGFLTGLLVVVALIRWVAVITAILYLAEPHAH